MSTASSRALHVSAVHLAPWVLLYMFQVLLASIDAPVDIHKIEMHVSNQTWCDLLRQQKRDGTLEMIGVSPVGEMVSQNAGVGMLKRLTCMHMGHMKF